MAVIKKSTFQADKISTKNKQLADENEKYAHYLNCVITAMNNSMSIKVTSSIIKTIGGPWIPNIKLIFQAKTQIEIFNLVTEVGNCQYKMERLPQKFEIWKYNADEDMKVIEFCTQEVIEEIDKVSDSIKEWFNRYTGFRSFLSKRVFTFTKRPFSFIIWVINV